MRVAPPCFLNVTVTVDSCPDGARHLPEYWAREHSPVNGGPASGDGARGGEERDVVVRFGLPGERLDRLQHAADERGGGGGVRQTWHGSPWDGGGREERRGDGRILIRSTRNAACPSYRPTSSSLD